MQAKKITDEEISNYKIASLPARPTTPTAYGGLGYNSKQMREAFDKLPLFIIERFNQLLEDIEDDSSDAIINSISLGRGDGMTAGDLIGTLSDGSILNSIPMGDGTLYDYLVGLRNDLDACMSALREGD